MKRSTAEKAAKWWADHLRKDALLDHGDTSPTGAMTIAVATRTQQAEKEGQTPEQIDAFEKALAKILAKKDGYVYLGVDYHPGHLLVEAAEEAELKLGMTTLPWKTGMWIDDIDTIKVSLGYGAEGVEI